MTGSTISSGTELWRNTPLKPSSLKSGYAESELYHPDNAVNQEFIKAGAADDHDWPLCFAVHDGEICQLIVRRGSRYCWKGRGDE